ncbi:sensor histidine kinase [Herbiconiux daphne]|uniref:histidine kinase n=1 Tax=Herbiconiux daphne TaxID=2970914 RepID=A0ABT2H872_9MICO|nr:histidine kinase [Herbiconiux daphne]MCS5736139.1 histidine kinase [Herbiconiux daphne]
MPHPGRTLDDQWRERARLRAEARERWHRGEWPGLDEADWGPRFRLPRWATLWVPVIVSLVVQVPAAVFSWRFRHIVGAAADDPARFAAQLGLALVGPIALVFARRFPGPVVAVISAAAGAYVLVVAGDTAPPYIALAFAIVGATVRGARVWVWCSVGAAWLLTLALGIALRVPWQPALVVAVSLGLVLLVVVGEALRSRRRRFDELRRRSAERRLTVVQAERVRIARELHDVLAHSLSQINVQAGVGLHLIDSQPDKAAAALANIKETSKSALDEVRSVLGVLRADVEGGAVGGVEPAPLVPEPDLSRLEGLVASVVSQGLAVTLDNGIGRRGGSGAGPGTGPGTGPGSDLAGGAVSPDDVPKGVQLALYRIVQESLTNVIRHASATSATVVLTESPDAYTVTITDDGRGPGANRGAAPSAPDPGPAGPGPGPGTSPSAPGTFATRTDRNTGAGRSTSASGSAAPSLRPGRGLLGMRERAELLGGRLRAGARPEPETGFVVEAVIPRHPSTTASPASTSPTPPHPTAPTASHPAPPTPPRAAPPTASHPEDGR